jgi:subtilisin family serine protease
MKSYIIKFIEGIAINITQLSQYGKITHNLTSVFNGVILNTNTTFTTKLPFIDFIEETVNIDVKQIQQTNYAKNNVFWGLDSLDGNINNKYPFEYTGKGVNVYIFDTGIDTKHQEFDNRAINFDGNGDCGTHGTHVAGIIGGRTTGVAKEVNLIGLNLK